MTQTPTIPVDISDYVQYIDKDLPQPEQFNYEATRDSIRHMAFAIEDYNALYQDAEFARTTRWAGIIAPPGYLYSHGNSVWLRQLGVIRNAEGQELAQNDNAGEEWDFYLPVRPGDTILSYGKVVDAVAKRGQRTGMMAIVTSEVRYTNQRNELVAKVRGASIRFNREMVGERGGMAAAYPKMEEGVTTRNVVEEEPPPSRTPSHEYHPRRYDPQLYYEDAHEDMEIPTWEIGPLSTTILGRYTAATSGGGGGVGGARQGGVIPDAFAPGVMRTPWFGSLLTRWAGPNGWIRKLTYQNREWLLVGFKAISKGKVLRKYVEDGRHLVECQVWCENDLGMLTNPGAAIVELPSRS